MKSNNESGRLHILTYQTDGVHGSVSYEGEDASIESFIILVISMSRISKSIPTVTCKFQITRLIET